MCNFQNFREGQFLRNAKSFHQTLGIFTRILTEMEIDVVAGSNGGGFWSGVGTSLDNAGRGALVGGTLGMALGPEMGALGTAAGAVIGAGVGFLGASMPSGIGAWGRDTPPQLYDRMP